MNIKELKEILNNIEDQELRVILEVEGKKIEAKSVTVKADEEYIYEGMVLASIELTGQRLIIG